MIKRYLPGLLWLDGYRTSTFKSDLISGLTIAVMLIPQGMGYALVAGLPPEVGLYACVLPPIIYAVLGTSNKVSIGPVALDSILIIVGLSIFAEPGTDRYIELAIMLTLMVGLIQSVFGMIKMGFIANFLSYPIIIGYTSAAAIVISCSQLDSLLGLNTDGGNAVQIIYSVFTQINLIHWITALLGIFGIAFLLIGKRINSKWPLPLILLSLGMALSEIFSLAYSGVDVVSNIPQGFPAFTVPALSIGDAIMLAPLAFTVALMGYVGSMSICKSLEKPTDKMYAKPNQELIALGVANVVGGLFRSYPVSASFSRSAAFRESGAKTQVSAIVSSVAILSVLLFLAPLFMMYPLPKTLLSVVVIVSVMGLFKYSDMKLLARHNRTEFWICMATFFATLLINVQAGLTLGVVLSILMLIYKTTNPHMTELGSIEDGKLFRNIKRFPHAYVRPDVLIFRFDAPLYYANKDFFVERLYSWIKKREGNTERLRYVLLEAESINSIDATGLQMLSQVHSNLEGQGIHFCIANAIGPVRDAIKNSSFTQFVCENCMFTTVHDAINYFDNGVAQHASTATQTNCK